MTAPPTSIAVFRELEKRGVLLGSRGGPGRPKMPFWRHGLSSGAAGFALLVVGCTGSRDRALDPLPGAAEMGDDVAHGTVSDEGSSESSATGGLLESTSGDETSDSFKYDAGLLVDIPANEPTCPCAPDNDLVYLLSNVGELWTYDPVALAFERRGAFDCPGFSNLTFALGVDFRGQAHVVYDATGDIFVVDTQTLDCTDPGYEPPANEPRRFGISFIGNESGPCETMLGFSFDGSQWSEGPGVGRLVRFDGPTLVPTTVAELDYNGGELMGTGDGRIFAFSGAPQAKLIELDPSDGSTLAAFELPGVELTDAFAGAFWGGDFHLFTQSTVDPDVSRVLRFDHDESDGPSPGLAVAVEAAPALFVGAASSTCAPVTPAG